MQPFRRYTWPVNQPEPAYPNISLNDAEYGKAIQSLLLFCTDIVPYHAASRSLILAERGQLPMQGTWFIGGRVRVKQSIPDAAVRHFKLDTGLDITFNQLEYLFLADYCWHDRQQVPQDTPSRNVAMTFGLSVTDEQAEHLLTRDLREPEYVPNSQRRYGWDDLQDEATIHPVLPDIWQAIFGSPVF